MDAGLCSLEDILRNRGYCNSSEECFAPSKALLKGILRVRSVSLQICWTSVDQTIQLWLLISIDRNIRICNDGNKNRTPLLLCQHSELPRISDGGTEYKRLGGKLIINNLVETPLFEKSKKSAYVMVMSFRTLRRAWGGERLSWQLMNCRTERGSKTSLSESCGLSALRKGILVEKNGRWTSGTALGKTLIQKVIYRPF